MAMSKRKPYKKRKGKPIEQRIIAKSFIPITEDGSYDKEKCWEWQGGTNNAGYGLIREEGIKKMVTVHRAMGRHINLKHGPKDEIQHTCLNKLCVNPNHLVNGVPQDRSDRMVAANRYNGMFNQKELMWPVCEYCGDTTYLPHFKRIHAHCKQNRKNKYIHSQIIRKSI